ncbi:heterokaryon incompatibility Het-C [Cryphonectria parasitica EP155]|uniref:Heterokaryon incompatibility Het-C n=1 Tax=Cryphonectria parasitica (strain ATCC 38755 / EP155) TaxID=660469 RepID=A0A9P4Y2H1_CRYP1|nr:heterokaryon incompatibility Het-C [Cryphonectria parasitica EP155]KAF3765356.1 heterokaryon incompatibility Het-C [Cryphonectria parasitica EP155]
MPSATSLLILIFLCLLLVRPAAAFGAGEVPAGSEFKGMVWRHGDLADILKYLPSSFLTGYRFTKLQRKQVYFGNWLRDFSQVIDTTCLENVPEAILRAIVSVLAFMEFGFATDEFDVTRERLGCYTHVEHIDNPSGYPDNAQDIDGRLRGPVDPRELEMDPQTGMKNYIANSGKGWDTAADYIRDQLSTCIALGRRGRRKHQSAAKKDAFRHLGAALHTLEDFAAHSNFTELCLRELGEEEVFAFVGDACRVKVPHGPNKGNMVAPIVTGTFGMLDIFHSLLGEADDKAVLQSKGSLGELESKLNYGGMAFEQLFQLIKTGIEQLSKIQPDLDPLLSQLQAVGEIFKKYAPVNKNDDDDDDDDDDNKETRTDEVTITDANVLWQAIEPVLYLHDRVSKYLHEGLEDTEESIEDYSHGQLGEYTNQLVFKYLAIMIESSVRALRNAVKAARDRVDEEAAKADSAQVYLDGTASDPSHSDLSKDHFSNVLNQPAGLVATITTNWTVQQVVRCWDDSKLDADRCIDEILTVLHHPAFPREKTPIQQYMFTAIDKWWNANPPEEKDRIRAKLTKESVQQRQHEDHTLTLKDFEGKQSGPASFPNSWPKVRQPPKKASIFAEWANDAIADFNWALGIVQRGRRGDPFVFVALVYSIAHGVMWILSKLLWPFGPREE